MKKIIVAVGSKRGPKLNAVMEALQSFSAALAQDSEFEIVGVEVESGVSHTPASRDELMRGARQRLKLCRKSRSSVWLPGNISLAWKAGSMSCRKASQR